MQAVHDADEPSHRVFISYSSSDRHRVDGLERLLVLFGHEVFMDCKTIRLGSRWKDEIHAALEQTDVTLVFWTRSASLSSWVRNEYEYFLAHHSDRPLVPVLGDNTPLAEPLKERQTLSFIPVVNELVELKRSMETEGRKKSEIQAAIRKRLEEAGVAVEESDLKRIFRFVGVAGWIAWLPAPLLLFEWVWRSLFEGVAQLSRAQAALVVISAAASGAVTWQAGGYQLYDERQKRKAVEEELKHVTQDNEILSSHALVEVSGIKQPTVVQLTSRTNDQRYTVFFPIQQDLHLLVPAGSYQAEYALPDMDAIDQPLVKRNGALLTPTQLSRQKLEGGEEYTLQLPAIPLAPGVASGPNTAGGNSDPPVAVTPNSIIETVAGSSPGGDDQWGDYGGDNGPAAESLLNNPSALAIALDGSLYVADTDNHRVRRIAPDGVITTVAGTGSEGFSGDGQLAVKAALSDPRGLALGPDGSLYIHDSGNHRVRRMDAHGIIVTVAGGGTQGLGDGGPATDAQLSPVQSVAGGLFRDNAVPFPRGLQVARDGSLFVVDANRRVRWIDPGGVIWTYAGGGENDSGEDGPATDAELDRPFGLALGPDGALFVADDKSIRMVSPDGLMTTLAMENEGNRQISAVAIGPEGGLYFCETAMATDYNDRHGVKRLLANGKVMTLVGDGERGNSGDGGPVKDAQIQGPNYIAVAADGTLYFSDSGNHRIRKILPDTRTKQ